MNDILEIAKTAALKAGEYLKKQYSQIKIEYKGINNLVTQADYGAEEIIVRLIQEKYPDHAFLCEEKKGNDPVSSEKLWIIDPLDGTNNYSHHIPHYCVSIAYAEKGEVLTGVVYDPVREELFSAIKGKCGFLNNERIEVSKTKLLEHSIFATGFYYDRGKLMERTLDSVHRLFKNNIRGIRRMGSAALDLCWVACGRYDGFFEYQLSAWDFAAGMLLVDECRGANSDRYGEKMGLDGVGIISSNGIIHKEFTRLVRWEDK